MADKYLNLNVLTHFYNNLKSKINAKLSIPSGTRATLTNTISGNQLDIQNTIADTTVIYISNGSAISNRVLPSKNYVDTALDGKQSSLTQDSTSPNYYVNADVEGTTIQLATKGYVDSKDPFMLLDFQQQINAEIPYCTENLANTAIANIDVSISDELGVDWAIASLAKYEVYDATSGGNRINCFPVCMFSMNTQKTLRLRMMCGGTSRKTARRIAGAILLKRR